MQTECAEPKGQWNIAHGDLLLSVERIAFCCRRFNRAAADGGTFFKIRPPAAAAIPNSPVGGNAC